ncbi:nuclease-related domain-containing protein, partial [Oxalobacteraceae bacterium R-40]|nr:nuclease-related domain-containing protein [Oxalobacteraceae bacterium R-40]
MSKENNPSEDMLSTLLGMAIAAAVLYVPFIMKGLLYPFRGWIWRQLQLERVCLSLVSRKWLYLPVKWTAPIAFAYFGFQAFSHFRQVPTTYYPILVGILYAIGMLLCALTFNAIHWMEQYFHTPSFQKKLAGIAAENHVKELIHAYQRNLLASRSLHGALFVFYPGSDKEFSVEADHILLTERNIFVIETKYKSGTITANATATHWEVTTAHGDSQMRNALIQAKNAAQILARECNLPCRPIPLVAIQGKDLVISNAPTNVVRAENIWNVIDAFELNQSSPGLPPLGRTHSIGMIQLSEVLNAKKA